jgi:acetyl esterase/lipase
MKRSASAALPTWLLLAAGGLTVAAPPVPIEEDATRLLVRDVICAGDDGRTPRDGPALDVYGPERTAGPPRPIVLFIHGGGWRHGDKSNVGAKPAAFVSRGYLFASVGYRLDSSVTPRGQGADVAAAVAWLHEHAREYGGDGDTIFLIGHSAGAHLAALVGTDERLLARHRLAPGTLAGVVLLDGAGYDVPRQMAEAGPPRLRQLYRDAFGDDPQAQREASPITHVAAGKRYPPFLIFHVGQRRTSREQSESLADRLRSAGGRATTVHEPDKNHLTLNRELGVADDGPTARILEFLEAR